MKAVIQIGYRSYIMEPEEALALLQVIAKAERYEQKYRNENEGGTSYHIWNEAEESRGHDAGSLRLITDDHYRIAKLAGAPPKS
jgi:hypothetical protein